MPDPRLKCLNDPVYRDFRVQWTPPAHDPQIRCLDWKPGGTEMVLEFVNEHGERCVGGFLLTIWKEPPDSLVDEDDYDGSLPSSE